MQKDVRPMGKVSALFSAAAAAFKKNALAQHPPIFLSTINAKRRREPKLLRQYKKRYGC